MASFWSELKRRTVVIQSEISMAIAAALQANLSADERQAIASIPTESLEAYEVYQLGRQELARRSTQSVARAIELFTEATDIDRDFAEAWVELTTSYLLMTSLSGLNADEMHKNARAAVDEALRIDPQLAETQTALANVLRNTGDPEGAMRAIENALAANPNYAYAHFIYANLLHESGNLRESLAEYERAAKLDPLSPVINDAYAFTLSEVGRFDEALARYKLVDAVEPEYPSAAMLGKQDEALAALRQAYDQSWVTDWRYFFYVDPNLDGIRDTAEFQEIFTLIKEDMAEQLERTHQMEANGEILPVP